MDKKKRYYLRACIPHYVLEQNGLMSSSNVRYDFQTLEEKETLFNFISQWYDVDAELCGKIYNIIYKKDNFIVCDDHINDVYLYEIVE